MEYPRYTRDQNLACKLSDKDILNIKSEYSLGNISQRALAKKYGVAQTVICYWVNEEYRKKSLERRKKYPNQRGSAYKTLSRKLKIMPRYREYMREADKKYYKKHAERCREYKRIYRKNNLEKERLQDKEYYYRNRERINYNRRKK